MARPPLTDAVAAERFWARSAPEPNTGCWLYTGDCNAKGYGQTFVRGRRMYAHRRAYQLSRGPIPEGMMVCHHCDTTACINPDHLFLGTAFDNNADMTIKGRRASRVVTHCLHGHEFTPTNTHVVPGETKRRCRACWITANARARAKRKSCQTKS